MLTTQGVNVNKSHPCPSYRNCSLTMEARPTQICTDIVDYDRRIHRRVEKWLRERGTHLKCYKEIIGRTS